MSIMLLPEIASQQKFTPGFNFTNVLRAAFTRANPKSAKKTVKLSSFFALLGSTSAKAAHRTLVKLTPDRLLMYFDVQG